MSQPATHREVKPPAVGPAEDVSREARLSVAANQVASDAFHSPEEYIDRANTHQSGE